MSSATSTTSATSPGARSRRLAGLLRRLAAFVVPGDPDSSVGLDSSISALHSRRRGSLSVPVDAEGCSDRSISSSTSSGPRRDGRERLLDLLSDRLVADCASIRASDATAGLLAVLGLAQQGRAGVGDGRVARLVVALPGRAQSDAEIAQHVGRLLGEQRWDEPCDRPPEALVRRSDRDEAGPPWRQGRREQLMDEPRGRSAQLPGRGLVPDDGRDRRALTASGSHRGALPASGRIAPSARASASSVSAMVPSPLRRDRPGRTPRAAAGTGTEALEGHEQAEASIGRAGFVDHRVVREDIGQRSRFIGQPIGRIGGVHPDRGRRGPDRGRPNRNQPRLMPSRGRCRTHRAPAPARGPRAPASPASPGIARTSPSVDSAVPRSLSTIRRRRRSARPARRPLGGRRHVRRGSHRVVPGWNPCGTDDIAPARPRSSR